MSSSIYPPTSPYYGTDIVNGNFLDVMKNRPIPSLPSDMYWEITPVYNLRPDLLAYDLYADSRLWWIFGSRNPNRLADPFFDFLTGVGIYIPKLDALKSALGL